MAGAWQPLNPLRYASANKRNCRAVRDAFSFVLSHVPSIFQELKGRQRLALSAGMADWRGMPYLGGGRAPRDPNPPMLNRQINK